MASKEEEQRELAVAGANTNAHPSLAPAFSCRRWSRLTGNSISLSDARAWRKRSQQRARTAPDYCEAGRESELPVRLLPASPRPVEGTTPSGLTPLGTDQMSILVERVYGGRASPRERRQQQRKQQINAVKDAIYLPAVTSRSTPPLSRDRQTADRPARQPRCVTEPSLTGGGWLSSPIFLPPPGLKLLSSELPELRARLMRYKASNSSQDQCVLFFSPTPPPPEVTRVTSTPSTGQTSPGSREPHQSRRPASQQHQRHYRKLKNRDDAPITRAQAIGGAPRGDFAGATSTGSLEADIVGALEARETGEPARGFGHDRRDATKADKAHLAARSDSEAATDTSASKPTPAPPNDQQQELDALVVDERHMPPSAPEPILEEEKMNEGRSPLADLPRSCDVSGSLSRTVLEASDVARESQDRHDESAGASCAVEAPPEHSEDQLPVGRDVELHVDSNGDEGVDLRVDGACDENNDSGKAIHLDASAVCHETTAEVTEGPRDTNNAEILQQQHATPSSMVSSSPAASITTPMGTASSDNVLGVVSDGEDGGESCEATEATEAPALAVQPPEMMNTLVDSIVSIGDLENDVKDEDDVSAQGARDRDGMIDGNDEIPVADSTAGNPEKQRQHKAPIAAPEVSTVDPNGPPFDVGQLAHDSEGDDYSDRDVDGDNDATMADQNASAGGLRPPHHSMSYPTEPTPTSDSRGDSSHPASAARTGDSVDLTRSEFKVEAGPRQATKEDMDASASSRRPSLSTYDADFEDEGDDEEDPELEYYDSDQEDGNED